MQISMENPDQGDEKCICSKVSTQPEKTTCYVANKQHSYNGWWVFLPSHLYFLQFHYEILEIPLLIYLIKFVAQLQFFPQNDSETRLRRSNHATLSSHYRASYPTEFILVFYFPPCQLNSIISSNAQSDKNIHVGKKGISFKDLWCLWRLVSWLL